MKRLREEPGGSEVAGLLDGITVLAVEQAMALPYCTWRLAMDGAKVIKIEQTRGDPNRKVGARVLGEEDMCTHFLPMNVGKYGITLNLKDETGQKILRELIQHYEIDVFACNQIPSSYEKLGVDYESLSSVRKDLIWLGISGFGLERPEAAYDPMIQAYSGLMDTNGPPESLPLRLGVSIVDMEAGNQGYCEVIKALYHRERAGEGRRIDLSMTECALSLLSFQLSATSMGEKPPKSGNQHPTFAPVDVYPTKDGYVSIAVGNDTQWKSITQFPSFSSLSQDIYGTNEGRKRENDKLTYEVSAITSEHSTEELIRIFRSARIPVSVVNTLEDVLVNDYLSGKLINVCDPVSGVKMKLAPPPVLASRTNGLKFTPRLGEHNAEIYGELGYNVVELRNDGVI
ncbi:MAG: CoA transferase [Candidatus Thermoplasmatota archaeon]|jgi:crotonobetainyl-CoA:carnitine CoA-transferase CaiB-like acyl-CoA transferase|nr:CoA transferase [Candidatus Thermoplasmatota archaeon]